MRSVRPPDSQAVQFAGYRCRRGGLSPSELAGRIRGGCGYGVEHRWSTGPALRFIRGRDHRYQRTSRSPGRRASTVRAPERPHATTEDLVDRMRAGQRPATGAPPGTRTPNPRIKSRKPVVSPRADACRLMSFPPVNAEGDAVVCRYVSRSSPAAEHRSSTASGGWCSTGDPAGERCRRRSSGFRSAGRSVGRLRRREPRSRGFGLESDPAAHLLGRAHVTDRPTRQNDLHVSASDGDDVEEFVEAAEVGGVAGVEGRIVGRGGGGDE